MIGHRERVYYVAAFVTNQTWSNNDLINVRTITLGKNHLLEREYSGRLYLYLGDEEYGDIPIDYSSVGYYGNGTAYHSNLWF